MAERIVYRSELRKAIGVCYQTMNRWLDKGKLPPPDISLTPAKTGWKISTLEKFGIAFLFEIDVLEVADERNPDQP